MDWRSAGLTSLCGALAIFTAQAGHAHLANPGYSGLISTPNAEVLQQGQIAAAFSWIDGPESYLFAPKTNRIYAVTVGILPGLELTLRQTQVIGWYDSDAPGVQHAFDRMFSAKYSLPLLQNFPHVAIGMQDIASGNVIVGARGVRPGVTQYGQPTIYGVLGENFSNWAWHGGIGVSQAFINGFFGGIEVRPTNLLSLLVEWDSKGLNWGIRMQPLANWRIQSSLINGRTWGLSSEIQINL